MTAPAPAPPAAPGQALSAVPGLPVPRGPLSEQLVTALRRPPSEAPPLPGRLPAGTDPLGEDAQLALYAAYELHYRSFAGVADSWEWDPGLLRLRAALEEAFGRALRGAVPGGDDVDAVLEPLLEEPVEPSGTAHHLQKEGTWGQMREYLAHRSVYHLKEADPHAWVIPRLTGQAKASLVAVEYDEFGGGRGDRVHARLFADLMEGAGLDPAYGRYLDLVPAVMLANVNLMSWLGLHRGLRGALVGHFTAVEVTSSPGSRRLAAALDRLGAPPQCALFYTEHVEADAVHEQVLRRDVLGDLLRREPQLAADAVFGVQAYGYLEDLLGDHLAACWRAGRTSLLAPLPEPTGAPGTPDAG
ncbi:iron-containing redox enzyme family protein [Streptomyces sp. SCUT-3]|uniref:iron-containing redox enzyme family protein n=1 Tax=Streptomyces sp. SCUT-3 TaxID=2684469 RepID=UPI0015FA9983|nr:iron-containing redox enzyme family protein [Streptomyces sp. SCUT-3]QMV24512.1 iron-containing redox enzyme family protein [Streptomyces sp. SCUT-3]